MNLSIAKKKIDGNLKIEIILFKVKLIGWGLLHIVFSGHSVVSYRRWLVKLFYRPVSEFYKKFLIWITWKLFTLTLPRNLTHTCSGIFLKLLLWVQISALSWTVSSQQTTTVLSRKLYRWIHLHIFNHPYLILILKLYFLYRYCPRNDRPKNWVICCDALY